jgi:hypothetical protein
MWRFLAIALLGASASIGGCGGDKGGPRSVPDPLSAVIEAADETTEAGPARARVSVIGPGGEHELAGVLDLGNGYRLCALNRESPDQFQQGQLVWLGERSGVYGTLLSLRLRRSGTSRCSPRTQWLDDHPPTLSFYPSCPPKCLLRHQREPQIGAEDFIHAVLLVLTRLEDAGVRAALEPRCVLGDCYTVTFDFTRFDRRIERDEDLWTLRPLLRSLGRYDTEVRVGQDGLVDRLRLAAASPTDPDPTPSAVAVEIELSHHGDAAPVPEATATAIE